MDGARPRSVITASHGTAAPGAEDRPPAPEGGVVTTTEVDIAGANVHFTSCPRCQASLAAMLGELEGSKFGKCEACGFVFVLAEGSVTEVPISDPRVLGAKRLIPFRSQGVQKSVEEITGEPTNVDAGIRERERKSVAMLVSEVPPMRVVLTQDATIIGRVKADVLIESPDVSRRHAVIERKGNAYIVRDLGSTNGTYVNGARVEEAPLAHGDRLVVGQTVFHFETTGEGEGIYLLLAMAPVGESVQSVESQQRCLRAWNAALAVAFGSRERDVLSSDVTGRALAIFPFDDTPGILERRDFARIVLGFPRVFAVELRGMTEATPGDEARVAVALGPAKRVVQDGKSKLTGEIIHRIAGLFSVPAPPWGGGVIEEASLHRILSPSPDEPVTDILGKLGYEVHRDGDATQSGHSALTFNEIPPKPDALLHQPPVVADLYEKARVGLEGEIMSAFTGSSTGKKILARGASADDIRIRSGLYRAVLERPIYMTPPLLLQWLHHLEDAGRLLEKFVPIRTIFGAPDLLAAGAALQLLGSAYHGLPDLLDLDLRRLTGAAENYLLSIEPAAAEQDGHALGAVLQIYRDAQEVPRDEAEPVNLFEFLVLLALIRGLRTRGTEADLAMAKTLLDSLKTYSTIWGQMLREEKPPV
ncbi:MAG: FHA domain-containing protein [Acidobacteriota bacterium]